MIRKSQTKLVFILSLFILATLIYVQYRYYSTTGYISTSDILDGIVVTDGLKHSIDLNHVISSGPGKDVIPALDEPNFESVPLADVYLDDAGLGVSVEVGGKHRFYPYQILVWHEVINDNFLGVPLLITYDPLSFSSIVFKRMINDREIQFGVSGQVYNSNILLFDRGSDSLWMQMTGDAVVGEQTGSKLERYDWTVMSWSAFKQTHSTGAVLSRKTGFERDYTRDPYGDYYTDNSILFTLTRKDERFHPKSIVYGFDISDEQGTFFEKYIIEKGIINEQVGSISLIVVRDADNGIIKAFDRTVNNQVLTFELNNNILVDKETATRWNLDGEAFSGTLRGQKLQPVSLQMSFWFAWFVHYPNSKVFTNN